MRPVLVLILFTSASVCSALSQATDTLPSPAGWLVHCKKDLLPFWTSGEALGKPVGNFPTWRNYDGTAATPETGFKGMVPEELRKNVWITSHRSVPMLSRQIYAYCAGYHLTNDERLLSYARSGIEYMMRYGSIQNGGFRASFENTTKKGEPGSSQEQAYALLGPAFYYYLTRDTVLFPVLLSKIRYFVKAFGGGESWRHFRFMLSEGIDKDNAVIPITSHLDQINTWLFIMEPLVPVNERPRFRSCLDRMIKCLVNEYFDPSRHEFYHTIKRMNGKWIPGRPSDFGHGAKAFWYIYLYGNRYGDSACVNLVRKAAPAFIENAFLDDIGAWGDHMEYDNTVNRHRNWFISAILNQLVSTLSMNDSSYTKTLARSSRYWLDILTDHRYGEVYSDIDDNDTLYKFAPKTHMWKNGFHSLEHCLVAYITSAALRKQPVELYFAFVKEPAEEYIFPHYFKGSVRSMESTPFNSFPKGMKYRVVFEKLRL